MTEDSQQISVAELLKRNGQTVESRGGRRRRGVAGGISVAELTGEIPIVRPGGSVRPSGSRAAAEPEPIESESAAPETPETVVEKSATEKSATEKSATEKSATEVAASSTSAPSAAASAPSPAEPTATEPPRTAAFAVTFDDEPDDSEIPVVKTVVVKAPARPAPDKGDSAEKSAASADLHKPISKNVPGQWVSRVPAKVTQEPALLSGQTLAGDLMRQEREVAQNAQNPLMRGPILPPHVTPVAENADASTELIDKVADAPAESSVLDMSVESPGRKDSKVSEAAGTEPAEGDESGDRSSVREWALLAGQVVLALIVGGAMFKGFEKLWDMLPWVALVLALIVIVGLVAVVRVLRKTDDITSFVIAVVVGMIVTLGPLAFLLTSG